MRTFIHDLPTPVLLLLALVACDGHTCYLFEKKCDPNLVSPQINSCPVDFNGFGGENQPCVDHSTCNGGLACVADNCIPCGATGEACCTQTEGGPGTCTSSTCVYNQALDWYTCSACGNAIGAACCSDNLCSVGMCDINSNTCVATSPSSTGQSYWVWVVTNQCGAVVFGFTSDNTTDAQAAAQSWFNDVYGSSSGAILGPVGTSEYATAPNSYQVCPTMCPAMGLAEATTTLYAFSPSELAACEHNIETCTWLSGACPGD
ncbi:MAG TPA: hypothetical protein VLX92_32670 [Kofleriaceae bacterium]|nr:hypothetical protein [Kofleriaceae bacterium]